MGTVRGADAVTQNAAAADMNTAAAAAAPSIEELNFTASVPSPPTPAPSGRDGRRAAKRSAAVPRQARKRHIGTKALADAAKEAEAASEVVLVPAGSREDAAALVDMPARQTAARKQRRGPRRGGAPGGAVADGDAAGAQGEPDGGPVAQADEQAPAVKKRRVKKEYLEIEIAVPPRELLPALAASLRLGLPPRPVPNLGYACLNQTLREKLRVPLYTNRDCIQRTFLAKGLPYISQLTLQNVKDLPPIIQWNRDNNIRLFRLSSCIVPWMSEVKDLRQLPDYEEIAATLRYAGDLARAYDQRLTFHPSHFVKLAAPDEGVRDKGIVELEVHSQVLDLMGFEPSPVNKINIHIGGVYGSKADTLARFAACLDRLSPGLRARLTVENDDTPNAFSTEDLLPMARATGVPIVFDFHHYKFIATSMSERESLHAAASTWPPGVRPVVHWSESQAGRIPKAHSDYVYGEMQLHGLEGAVDVMVEAKCKELAVQRWRQLRGGGGDVPADIAAAAAEQGAYEAQLAQQRAVARAPALEEGEEDEDEE